VTARSMILFAVGVVIGFACAIALVNAVEAGRASKTKRALGDARGISVALEQYKRRNGTYPPESRNANDLARWLAPQYLSGIPENFFTGGPYMIVHDDVGPIVVGLGRGGFAVRKGELIACKPYTSEGCR
jgi:hypothetical protein